MEDQIKYSNCNTKIFSPYRQEIPTLLFLPPSYDRGRGWVTFKFKRERGTARDDIVTGSWSVQREKEITQTWEWDERWWEEDTSLRLNGHFYLLIECLWVALLLLFSPSTKFPPLHPFEWIIRRTSSFLIFVNLEFDWNEDQNSFVIHVERMHLN